MEQCKNCGHKFVCSHQAIFAEAVKKAKEIKAEFPLSVKADCVQYIKDERPRKVLGGVINR